MIPKTDYKKIRGEFKPRNGSANGRGVAIPRPENIHTQLAEARFISRFMAAAGTSLELDDICSIAARALYEHAPYYRIDFAFSADFDGKTVTYSPMDQKKNFADRTKTSVAKSCSLSALHEAPLTNTHLTLLDNLGTINIVFTAGQGKTFSEPLLVSVATYFSQAIRNSLEHSRMKNLAMLDGLTKLYNRRIFDETLAQKVTCQDTNPVSLLLIDLDNFKQVNDTYGHQAGDHVLKTVARILKESCRGHDLVARFGGEEFAIIISQTQAATAHAVALRIKNRLEKNVFDFDNRQFKVTASIGLATCEKGSTIFTSNLVKRADRALYQAKRTGKNKVCVSPADLLTEVPLSLGAKNIGSFVSASC
jgi:diguanylate cyclase (GGDEF)-like protein